jgi:hypothetical protein
VVEAVQVVVELAVAASAVEDQAVVVSAVAASVLVEDQAEAVLVLGEAQDPLHRHRHIENQ